MSRAENPVSRTSALDRDALFERPRRTGFALYSRLILSDKLALGSAIFLVLLALAAILDRKSVV